MIRWLSAVFFLVSMGGNVSFARPRDAGFHDAQPRIQIALLLDTSNSMDGLINQAKSQLWKIVSEAGKMTRGGERARLEVALYEYGNDSNSILSGYVRKVMPFTDDLDALSAELFELVTYGGSEYCGTVIMQSLDDLDWSKNESDLRIVYIAGNEPFTQGVVNFRSAGKKAVRKNVVVNTIYCGSREEGVSTQWAEGARITGGTYLSIDGDYTYEYIPCPQDDRLSELNSRLNDTYIAYGTRGTARKEMQMEQDSKAEALNKSGFYERARVKSSSSYSNSSWDLVDAIAMGEAELEDMREGELPPELRVLPKEGREAYVAGKLAERRKLQEEISSLSAEREAWLQANQGERQSDSALDTAIFVPLESLAKDKGFVSTR